jgi:hypothetical protein
MKQIFISLLTVFIFLGSNAQEYLKIEFDFEKRLFNTKKSFKKEVLSKELKVMVDLYEIKFTYPKYIGSIDVTIDQLEKMQKTFTLIEGEEYEVRFNFYNPETYLIKYLGFKKFKVKTGCEKLKIPVGAAGCSFQIDFSKLNLDEDDILDIVIDIEFKKIDNNFQIFYLDRPVFEMLSGDSTVKRIEHSSDRKIVKKLSKRKIKMEIEGMLISDLIVVNLLSKSTNSGEVFYHFSNFDLPTYDFFDSLSPFTHYILTFVSSLKDYKKLEKRNKNPYKKRLLVLVK